MAASNLMIDARGQVSGLVDQVDLSTGDPLVVPGFALAMLGDVHAWPQVARYAKGWRRAWALDAQEWDRVAFHRLSARGRHPGKRWTTQAPEGLAGWRERARRMVAR